MSDYLPRHIASISAAENLIRCVIDDVTWSTIPIDARYHLLVQADELALKALRALVADPPSPLFAPEPPRRRKTPKPRP